MNTLRIGIVGCGEVTQILHLPSLNQLTDKFAVTALCDVSAETLSGVGDQWRVSKRYANYQDLIAQQDVDVVLVANPNAYHAEVTLAAIAAGKHVMVEKPMCITLREADAIADAQAKAGVTVQVGYMRRYAPAFVKACEVVKQMGGIRMARVHDVLGFNEFFIQNTSRVVRGKDIAADVLAAGQKLNSDLVQEAIGDVPKELQFAYFLMLGLCTHDISAMREMLGMPKRVLYAAQRQGGMYLTAAFDYGDFVCHFETGIDQIARFDAGLEVYGERQVVKVKYDTPYVRNLPIRMAVTEANEQRGVVEHTEHPTWGDPFVVEWLAFHDNVTNKLAPKTNPKDYRQDLELFRDMIERMK